MFSLPSVLPGFEYFLHTYEGNKYEIVFDEVEILILRLGEILNSKQNKLDLFYRLHTIQF